MFTINGHGSGVHAPGYQDIFKTVYDVAHNALRAHAAAYRVYQNEFKEAQGGELKGLPIAVPY